jgi:hypothetical protein
MIILQCVIYLVFQKNLDQYKIRVNLTTFFRVTLPTRLQLFYINVEFCMSHIFLFRLLQKQLLFFCFLPDSQ